MPHNTFAVGSNGGPEALELIHGLPMPFDDMGDNDVLIRVNYAGELL